MPRNANQSKSANYSLDFDGGSTTNINVGNMTAIQGASTFSISAWINLDSTGQQRIFGSWQTSPTNKRLAGLGIHGSSNPSGHLNQLILQVSSNGSAFDQLFSTSTITTTNTWIHVAVTFSSGTAEFYIDGASAGTDTSTTTTSIYDVSNDYFIGSFNTSTTVPFDGKMGQVCVFDYALSASQVTTLWSGGTSVSNPMTLPRTPIAYYPLGTSAWNGNFLAENNAIGDYVFDFSGALGESVITTSSYMPTSNFTVSLWFKHTMSTRDNYMFAIPKVNNSTESVWIYTLSGEVRITVSSSSGNADCQPSVTVNDGKWHQIIATWDSSGNLKCFIDGTNETTSPQSPLSGTVAYGDNIGIGGYWTTAGSGSTAFNGEISNVLVLDTVLTATEAQTLYNYGSPIRTLANIPQNSNLKAWYKLDASEIYNSSITDWEVNDATATYNSSSYVIGVSGQNTQYIQASSYDGLTGTSAGSWSFWYNTQDLGVTYGKNGGWLNGAQARWIQPYGTTVPGYGDDGEFSILTSDGRQRTMVAASYARKIFIDAPAASELNKWVHFVGTYDGSNLRVYINGQQVGLTNEAGTTITEFPATGTLTTDSIRFGGAPQYVAVVDSKFSNGSVWNKTLTLAEIVEIYNNGQPKSLSSHSAVSNLVSWWTLENFDAGLLDSIGSRNLTLTGSNSDVSPGSVSILNGLSSGMSQANLVTSDLQTVASYSKYAMNFDASSNNFINCGNDSSLEITGNFTISTWINITSDGYYPRLIGKSNSGNTRCNYGIGFYNYKPSVIANYNGTWYDDYTSTALSTGVWYNVVGIYDGSNFLLYVNGALDKTTSVSGFNIATAASETSGDNLLIAEAPSVSDNFDGKISNVSIWNTNLTHTQVREIYNEGLPKDLNSHSAYSNLISWWQLGENSSFATNWICADEKGTNNGESQNMGVNALTNGVGTTANGTSNGMAVGALVGDAPYSTANAVSSGMSVVSRVSGVSDATITTGGTGYSTGTNIATTGGSGTNCTINITTVSGGAITAITINSGGNDYLIGDVLTVSGGNGNATITVSGLNTP